MVNALILHLNDQPLASCVATLTEGFDQGKNRLTLDDRRPIVVGGATIGSVGRLSLWDKGKSRLRWSGPLVMVADGVKKAQALSALGLRRDETMYLALASRHEQWIGRVFPKRPDNIAYWVSPPQSDALSLNDFPYVFLLNDARPDFGLANRVIAICERLAEALTASRVWAKPRPPRERAISGEYQP